MKKRLSTNNPKALKRIWYVLLIALSIGTTLVFMQRIQNKGRKTSLKIDALRDSLWTKEISTDKSYAISNLIELYQQRQLLKSFQQKDSLNQKDLESIKKIDQKLNHLIDEEN